MVATPANSLDLASTTPGQIVLAQSSGIPTFSTSTYPSTNAINTLLYASSANVMSALATANNGVLVTSAGGVPSIGSAIPNAVTLPAVSGSSLVLISSQTASNSASINFTTLSAYVTYFVIFTNVYPATAGANLQIQMSNNGGSTYISTSYTAGVTYTAYNATAANNLNATTAWPVTGPATTNSNGFNGYCYIYGANEGALPALSGQFSWSDNTLSTTAFGTCAGYGGSTGLNAIKILFSSGNITGGTITVYGVKVA